MKEEKYDVLNVVYACDDCYAYLAGISCLSLLQNNLQEKYIHIFILDSNISEDSKSKLSQIAKRYQREITFVNTSDLLARFFDMGVTGYENAVSVSGSMTAYSRLFLGKLLTDVERVIYLDCDTLVVGAIGELFRYDIGNYVMGAVYDGTCAKYRKVIGMRMAQPYFNSGIMIMNLNSWRERKCLERIVEHVKSVRASYPLVDQDLINIVLGNEIVPVSPKFNMQSQFFLYSGRAMKFVYGLNDKIFYSEDNFDDNKKDVRVLHFCGNAFGRPWYNNSKHPFKQLYDKFYYESPWQDRTQEYKKTMLPYKIQYLAYKYLPSELSKILGRVMQQCFMFFCYHV